MAAIGRRPPLRDALLVALDLAAAAVVLVMLAPPMRTSAPVAHGAAPLQTSGWVTWVSWTLAAAVAGPILLRRRWPLAALAGLVGASAAAVLVLGRHWPGTIAPLIATALALYSAALVTTWRRSVTALVLCLAVSGAAVALGAGISPGIAGAAPSPAPWADTVSQTGFGLLMLLAAWVVGVAVRQQRAYAARSAELAARQALSDERHRIARELHDIIAHSMSLIAVKAGVANHVAQARPDEAREALRLIETTSRAALVDMRRVLGVLRTDIDGSTDLAPTPGLAELVTLADQAAGAGVRVEMAIDDPDGAVPQGVQLSVYRIVQEALTNVVKHCGPADCRVSVTVALDEVRIEVVDDGDAEAFPPDRPRTGHGLVGMRERVAAYGGTFSAGPQPCGGFAVHATLPYRPTTA